MIIGFKTPLIGTDSVSNVGGDSLIVFEIAIVETYYNYCGEE